ncbi:hypothetical protein BDP27DRAFT_1287938 [Rhodocollybia butyracea]|uniref:BZIP domain-containing protein n=1 Tax=Rhodocollybia butyracea TaxID=206335 RepID=A0A9P5UCT8_9AGAR|nr:hypothetical protein BDP27DRAFT_1287938 [Rhodocollybia butyracea]
MGNSHNVAAAPSTRSFELAALYGIPHSLPKPPKTTARPETIAHSSAAPISFEAMRQNYLSMLSNDPSATMAEHSTSSLPADPPPDAVDAPGPSSGDTEFTDIIQASPDFKADSFGDYLTSPFGTPYDDFNTSPMDDSPFMADLSTPIMDHIDDFEYGVVDSAGWMMNGAVAPLFDDASLSFYAQPVIQAETLVKQVQQHTASDPLNSSKLYMFSPSSPALDDFRSPVTQPIHSPVLHPTTSLYPSPRVPTSVNTNATPANRSRSKSRGPSSMANGTRRASSPSSLVPLNAPTQPRRYILPSATSRKANPLHANKRSHSEAFGDAQELDELPGEAPPGPNATEVEHIEWKRRQNTIAARKSRRRKLEHLRELESENSELKEERDRWKVRCDVLEGVLKANGMMVPEWLDE